MCSCGVVEGAKDNMSRRTCGNHGQSAQNCIRHSSKCPTVSSSPLKTSPSVLTTPGSRDVLPHAERATSYNPVLGCAGAIPLRREIVEGRPRASQNVDAMHQFTKTTNTTDNRIRIPGLVIIHTAQCLTWFLLYTRINLLPLYCNFVL